LERDTSAVVAPTAARSSAGVKAPDQHFGFLLVPAAGAGSKAKVIGLANAAATHQTRSSRRRIRHRGGRQKLAALLLFVNDVHSLGLKTAQGLGRSRNPFTGT